MLESTLFGMKHHDMHVAKCSLHGLASLPKEYLKNPQSLHRHLSQHPDIFDHCIRRLLIEVVFQNVVTDRLEPAGSALLYLVAIDRNRFANNTLPDLLNQLPDKGQRVRLQAAFGKLLQVELLERAAETGYEGRTVRSQFKTLFEDFVNDVHSFLLLR
jgi:hypothetical protein